MRTFVIGDIHGCYDELMELTEKTGLKEDDLLIALGDVVDRGNKSKAVYDFLRGRPNTIVLIGNHERKHQNGILSYAQEIVKVQFGDDYPGFLHWLDTLGYYYETADAIIVHAFFEHNKKLQEQKPEVLCGSTSGDRYLEKKYAPDTYWNEYYQGEKPIIYGHHVIGDTPKIANNTYGIDTGCCHGRFLTAIELPGFKIHQVKAKKDYWKEEQKIWQIPVLKAKNWGDMLFADIDKQLAKLAYIEEAEIVRYLADIKRWKEELQDMLPRIKADIDDLTRKLSDKHLEDFSMIAAKYSFKTYIFKSRSGKLETADLEKGLNTPNKIADIKHQLSSY